MLYYIGKTANIEDYQAFQTLIIEELPETIGEDMPTVFEQLKQEGENIGFQKGENIGLQKGKDIGAQQTREQLARRLLARGNLSIEEIVQLTDLLPSAIRELAEAGETVS